MKKTLILILCLFLCTVSFARKRVKVTRFTDMVLDKNLHEEILGMPDKHLDFHVSMWCGEYHEGKQELRITTVVKYNNWLGRAYFFIIRPFHGIIVKSILKHVAGDRGSGCK